jgi:hypothetical protein
LETKKNHRKLIIPSSKTDQWLATQSFQSLAHHILQETWRASQAEAALKFRIDSLSQEITLRVLRNGGNNEVASSITEEMLGSCWDSRLENARIGVLDRVYNDILKASIRSAQILLLNSEYLCVMHKLQRTD